VNQQTGNLFQANDLRSVWWLNPIIAFAIPAVVASIAAWGTDSTDYMRFWRTAKHFDLSSLQLVLAVVLVFGLGCLFGSARRAGGDQIPPVDWKLGIRWEAVRTLFKLSFALTIAAYGTWFFISIKNGLNMAVVLGIFRGAGGIAGEHLPTIPGITTATQFGLAVITLGVPLGAAKGWRTVTWQCAIVIVLAFIRAVLNNERLAVIELMVPLVISFIWNRPAVSRLLRFWVQAAPFVGVIFLYLVFATAEYFRSWATYYSRRESSFWSFMGLRLTGYYATALNNGALLWKVKEPLSFHLPYASLGFMWRLPVVKDAFHNLFPSLGLPVEDFPSARWADLLSASANPEFNNPSGIFGPIVDFGVAGGLLYWLLCGMICGFLYQEFKLRRVTGVFLYPAIYISLIEATRILYWATGRFFPDVVMLLVGTLFLFRLPVRNPILNVSLVPR
jgi:hypothetical protein